MVNVILRRVPDGSDDELVTIDLPHDVGVGHAFNHAGSAWKIAGEIRAEDTDLAVRGTSVFVAVPNA